jgi:hypothetical protein
MRASVQQQRGVPYCYNAYACNVVHVQRVRHYVEAPAMETDEQKAEPQQSKGPLEDDPVYK